MVEGGGMVGVRAPFDERATATLNRSGFSCNYPTSYLAIQMASPRSIDGDGI
jgi:hypothetical protein